MKYKIKTCHGVYISEFPKDHSYTYYTGSDTLVVKKYITDEEDQLFAVYTGVIAVEAVTSDEGVVQ